MWSLKLLYRYKQISNVTLVYRTLVLYKVYGATIYQPGYSPSIFAATILGYLCNTFKVHHAISHESLSFSYSSRQILFHGISREGFA